MTDQKNAFLFPEKKGKELCKEGLNLVSIIPQATSRKQEKYEKKAMEKKRGKKYVLIFCQDHSLHLCERWEGLQ